MRRVICLLHACVSFSLSSLLCSFIFYFPLPLSTPYKHKNKETKRISPKAYTKAWQQSSDRIDRLPSFSLQIFLSLPPSLPSPPLLLSRRKCLPSIGLLWTLKKMSPIWCCCCCCWTQHPGDRGWANDSFFFPPLPENISENRTWMFSHERRREGRWARSVLVPSPWALSSVPRRCCSAYRHAHKQMHRFVIRWFSFVRSFVRVAWLHKTSKQENSSDNINIGVMCVDVFFFPSFRVLAGDEKCIPVCCCSTSFILSRLCLSLPLSLLALSTKNNPPTGRPVAQNVLPLWYPASCLFAFRLCFFLVCFVEGSGLDAGQNKSGRIVCLWAKRQKNTKWSFDASSHIHRAFLFICGKCSFLPR